jgi:hypothetical protein
MVNHPSTSAQGSPQLLEVGTPYRLASSGPRGGTCIVLLSELKYRYTND